MFIVRRLHFDLRLAHLNSLKGATDLFSPFFLNWIPLKFDQVSNVHLSALLQTQLYLSTLEMSVKAKPTLSTNKTSGETFISTSFIK